MSSHIGLSIPSRSSVACIVIYETGPEYTSIHRLRYMFILSNTVSRWYSWLSKEPQLPLLMSGSSWVELDD